MAELFEPSSNDVVRYVNNRGSSTLENGYGVDDEDEIYSVYFKGLVSEEYYSGEEEEITVVRIGVVICDSMDNMVFQLGKATKCGGADSTSPMEAKLDALIEGLIAAEELEIKSLLFFCKGHKLYNYLNISLHNDISSSADLQEELLKIESENELKLRQKIEVVKRLGKEFEKVRPCLVMESNTKRLHNRALKLAREAEPSSGHGETLKETCGICLEQTDLSRMLSLHDCLHDRCLSCVKKHLEVKLREGTLPTCPHEGCKSSIKIRACKKVLSPELVELVEERLKESQIPVLERIYCPYPKCSNLMSKGEVLRYSKHERKNAEESGYRKCLKCCNGFCVSCKVPWHNEMTCCDYKRLNPYSFAEEEMLISIARRYSWRQCIKCSHMIELSAGCYHIICRCGYQFCYTCGLEWQKDKHCGCPLWDEHLIIY